MISNLIIFKLTTEIKYFFNLIVVINALIIKIAFKSYLENGKLFEVY